MCVSCRCGVTDETCGELAKLVSMTHLDLRYCPLTNAGMARVSQAMPRLEYCNVEGCKLTCLGMLALLRQHKRLRVWGPGALPHHSTAQLSTAQRAPCLAPRASRPA